MKQAWHDILLLLNKNMSDNNKPGKAPEQTPDKTKPEVILPGKNSPDPVTVGKNGTSGHSSDEEAPAQESDHVRNPNPRANENLPGQAGGEKKKDGPGSEITDGEDG